MVQVAENRPPYVQFELRPEEDREASLAAGHFVAKDVAYAIITPMGSKDRIECLATQWLEQLERDTQEGRFPREWLRGYQDHYKAWTEGNEPSPTGTPIEQWPPLSPAMLRMCRDARIRTVEDLAQANEETLMRIGMGGRALKDKAAAWMTASSSVGKTAERMAGLEADNRTLRTQLASLEATVTALRAEAAAKTT